MCWRSGNKRRMLVLVSCLTVDGLIVGCAARPAGTLLEPVDPPIVWPRAPEPARIRFVGMLSDSRDLSAGQSSREVFGELLRGPRPPIQFSSPHSIAISETGLLAVADVGNGAVHVVDLERRTHRMVSGWGSQRFGTPIGVAWAGARLFVTDAERHEVVELDQDGQYRQQFGQETLARPVGIAYVAKTNHLYVVDGGAHNVAVFDAAGNEISRIGRPGTEPGEFHFPTHIGWDGDERVLVADSGNFRVQVLDLSGNCLRVIGQKGDAAGDFSLPKGVAFDGDGHIYVVDTHFENVQIFDSEGRLLLAVGREGGGAAEFWLPAGLAIDQQDRIWVADAGNRRLQVFSYLRNTE